MFATSNKRMTTPYEPTEAELVEKLGALETADDEYLTVYKHTIGGNLRTSCTCGKCIDKDTDYLTTLKVKKSATNIGRVNALMKQTAKYRARKALVLSNIDIRTGNAAAIALSSYKDKGRIEYAVGEVVEPSYYDNVKTSVCTGGIHFFLDKAIAKGWAIGYRVEDNGVYDSGTVKPAELRIQVDFLTTIANEMEANPTK